MSDAHFECFGVFCFESVLFVVPEAMGRGHEQSDKRQDNDDPNAKLRQLKERARLELEAESRARHSSRAHDDQNRDDRKRKRHHDDDNERRRRRDSRSPQFRRPRNDGDRRRTTAVDNRANFEPKHFHKRESNRGSNQPTGSNLDNPEDQPPPEIKPNFELTGALAKDTNLFNGVVVKYNEPAEAKKPRKHWRLYPFKGDKALDFISVHRQSAYLLGRERKVADIPIDHPSCSKQHAVLQYRSVEIDRDDGTKARVTRPYIIDLESANGTFVNNKLIEARRYVQLIERDVIKFGFSTREYVLLHEQSQNDSDVDDDV